MNSQSQGWWAYVHVLHFSLANEQVLVPKALYRHLCRLVGKDFALYQPTQPRKLLATKAQVSFIQQTEIKPERNSPQWCWWQKIIDDISDNWRDLTFLVETRHLFSLPILLSQILQKWGASSRWPFGLNSAWGSLETTIIGKTHPTLS